MFESLQNFVEGLPVAIQWLGVALISAIPYVESYLGAAVGVVAGVWPPAAILAAILGNIISMLIFVAIAGRGREAITSRNQDPKPLSPRRQKLKQRIERFGVPVVSLLGQTLLPSQITSAAMVSFGINRRQVIIWQIISITLWGVIFGLLGLGGYYLTR